jgi:hypothetical protein
MGRAVKECKAAAKTAGKKSPGVAAKGEAERKREKAESRTKARRAAKDKAEAPVVQNETERQAEKTVEKPAGKRQRPVPDIQKHADIETRRAFREICEALLRHAREGAIPHTKLLIKIGKLEEKPSGRKRAGKSLSAILMEELRRTQAEDGTVEAARESAETGVVAADTEHIGREQPRMDR